MQTATHLDPGHASVADGGAHHFLFDQRPEHSYSILFCSSCHLQLGQRALTRE